MDIIEIIRKEESPTETISVVIVNKQVFGVVLEPPFKNNQQNISRIPVGIYKATKYQSKKFKRTCLSLQDVFGRKWIAMHNGTNYENTEGCLLLGRYAIDYKEKRAIMLSKDALKSLTNVLGKDIKVVITEDF